MDIRSQLSRLLEPLVQRLRLMVGRAVITAVNAGGGMQVVQAEVLADEVKNAVEHFQPYGFTSTPLPGAEAVMVFVGGNRDHGISIVIDDRRYRLKGLEGGDVALYTDLDDGDGAPHKVVLRRDRQIDVFGKDVHIKADGVLRLDGDGVEIHGRTYVQQDVHGKGQRDTHVVDVNYRIDKYTTGAVNTTLEHGLDQTDIPSDHPEGP